MERIKDQKDAVIEYMEKYGEITQGIANNLGIGRLAARIADIKEILKDPDKIKEYGWQRFSGRYVVTTYENVTNRFGQHPRIARYRLNVEDDE